MLSYALEKGFEVLKKNTAIFIPFIILGVISILGFLLVAKPMFELESISQSSYSSMTGGSNNYFFKKFMDILPITIMYSVFISAITILANVAGLRIVKDYLNGQKTKVSDIGKTILSKGFVAIFAVLAASILFFLPGIIGMLMFLSVAASIGSYSSMNIGSTASIMLIAFIMFFIQAIILLGFGYYILSGKFRKAYIWGIIITIILLILAIVIGFINPVLSLIFFIPVFILFIVIYFALLFLSLVVSTSIMYIIPSVVVLNENIGVTEAIKKSLNFAKDNTGKFSLLILIYFVIIIVTCVPSIMMSFANAMHPSFSLYIFAQIFTIALNVIVSPFILSVFALAYAFSLTKEKESEKENKGITIAEEIKSSQNLSDLGGLGRV